MIIYLVKSTLLLALLLSVYKLLLENEKMHGFNRYFLLFALVFGLTAPLLTFDVNPETTVAGFNLQKVKTIVDKPSEIVSNSVTPLLTPKPKTSVDVETEENSAPAISKPNLFTLKNILLGLYACITFMLLLRFISGLMEIVRNVRAGEKQKFEKATLVLLKEKIMPQSFFRFIFLNEKEFRLGNIGSEILEHELTHVKQLHSLDVLAVEILKLIFWFNPLFYFYKHAIQLNHEFLADEHVVTKITSTKEYQHILMHASSGDKSIAVTSKFSEPNTIKRILMMGKKASILSKFSRYSFFIPFLLLSVLIFCDKSNPVIPDVLYSDVKLQYKVLPIDYTKTYKREPTLDWKGTPYTGTQNMYFRVDDRLSSTHTFIDGYLTEMIYYDGNGTQTMRYVSEYEKGYQILIQQYDKYNTLLVETKSTIINDGVNILFANAKEWHKNGKLKYESSYYVTPKSTIIYEGLMTLYDDEGNTHEQELYKDGELVEKIK